jgi:undecaprenyl pyrophosphate phosphatase UppP
MTFCPNCGTSLKPGTTWQAQTTPPPYDYYRHRHRQEKEEKNEKAEKHEKAGGGYFGLVIAGLVVLFIGLLSYLNATTGFLTGPVASAIVVVIIGLIIVVAGVYYASRSRSRNPVPA